MEKDPEQQNYEFTDAERAEILQKEFNCKHHSGGKVKKETITDIIDGVINAIKDDDKIKDCIKKHWFTKQIEKWNKDDNNKNKELDDEVMNIVKALIRRSQHRSRFRQRKEYRFYRCPSCGTWLRVPRDKGRLQITCRQCGERFTRKT